MSDPKTCPTCGVALTSDATRGACPKCLLEAGFATGGTHADDDRVPTIEGLAPKFPGLVIEERLGRGGMGVVYRARHKALDREVALKVLSERVAQDKAFADRFQREARALARLQHPNIVAVHDFGVTEGLFWLVMEYVNGANIRQAMRAGTIGPEEALAIVPQICDALQYAHEHGVVHRDIKPENVLLDRAGHVKVADFGLAKLTETNAADRALTGVGQVMGTPHYMAPEQVEHPGGVDHRADIYSLGVVFYEMLTGELPLGRFAPPSKRCDVDARIDEIVLRTLEKEREVRYQQAAQVKTDVGAVTDAPASAARPTGVGLSGGGEARLTSRLRVLSVCHYVNGVLAAIAGLLIGNHLLGIRSTTYIDPINNTLTPDEFQAIQSTLGVLFFTGVLAIAAGILLAALSWASARAMRNRRHRAFSVIVAVLDVFTGPQGIVLGLLTAIALLGRDAERSYKAVVDRASPPNRTQS